MAHTFSTHDYLPSPTGAKIAFRHQPATDTPRAVVQINHGLAEHSARYGRFAVALAEQGFDVYAHDHRGHGLTTANDAPKTVFSNRATGAEMALDDIAAIHAHIRKSHPGLPIIVFGHSMGGLFAMNYALRNPSDLAGAAVWNSNFTTGPTLWAAKTVLAYERFRLGSDLPSRILPMLTFQAWAKSVKNAQTPFDWLSHRPEEVQAYIDDPECGWDASVSMWRDVFRLVQSGADVANASKAAKALPFMLVGGGKDPATFGGKAVSAHAKRMKRAGFSDVTLKLYPDARHETLNDLDAERAISDFLAWADKVGTS